MNMLNPATAMTTVFTTLRRRLPSVRARLGEYRNAVRRMDDWSEYDGLHTLLGAPAEAFALSERYTTKSMRSMGRVAVLATRASGTAGMGS